MDQKMTKVRLSQNRYNFKTIQLKSFKILNDKKKSIRPIPILRMSFKL